MHLVNGFVKIQGADDLEDAPVAASLCVLTGYKINKYAVENSDLLITSDLPLVIDLRLHIRENGTYQRHNKSKYLFSRDQTLCLWAGFKAQGLEHLVDRDRVDGKDWFLPGNLGHEKRCKGENSNAFFDWWLNREIDFHARFTPLEESNQLLAQLIIAGPDWVNKWTQKNKNWADSIINYWGKSFRNEPHFARHLMLFVQLYAAKARV